MSSERLLQMTYPPHPHLFQDLYVVQSRNRSQRPREFKVEQILLR